MPHEGIDPDEYSPMDIDIYYNSEALLQSTPQQGNQTVPDIFAHQETQTVPEILAHQETHTTPSIFSHQETQTLHDNISHHEIQTLPDNISQHEIQTLPGTRFQKGIKTVPDTASQQVIHNVRDIVSQQKQTHLDSNHQKKIDVCTEVLLRTELQGEIIPEKQEIYEQGEVNSPQEHFPDPDIHQNLIDEAEPAVGEYIHINWPPLNTYFNARVVDYSVLTGYHTIVYSKQDDFAVEELIMANRKWHYSSEPSFITSLTGIPAARLLVGKIIVLEDFRRLHIQEYIAPTSSYCNHANCNQQDRSWLFYAMELGTTDQLMIDVQDLEFQIL